MNGKALVARFCHTQRAAEADAYLEWFRDNGYRGMCGRRKWINEGEGDYLVTGSGLLAGTGFRTNVQAHRESAESSASP